MTRCVSSFQDHVCMTCVCLVPSSILLKFDVCVLCRLRYLKLYLTSTQVMGIFHRHSFYCLQWYILQTLVYNEILKVSFQNHKVCILNYPLHYKGHRQTLFLTTQCGSACSPTHGKSCEVTLLCPPTNHLPLVFSRIYFLPLVLL